MDDTPNLRLPFIVPAQAQKHVTHNEALRVLDCIVQLSVLDRDLGAPPSSPVEGARYIVAQDATGAWSGRGEHVALWQDGTWVFHAPQEGWIAWVRDEDALLAWDGSNWIVAGGGGGGSVNPVAMVGINATADVVNRLSIKSDAVLLSHDDVTPGSGDMRAILNKAATDDTTSFLFQTGFSGHAEVGLAGDDHLRVKVSADGVAWKEAIVISNGSGFVGLLGATPTAPITIDTDSSGLSSGAAAVRIQGGVGAERIEFRGFGAIPNAAFQGFGVRGSAASPSPTLDGDRLFAVLGSGYDGAEFVVPLAAQIDLVAKGNWSTVSHGAAIVFRTTPNGGTTAARAERLRILDNGNVRVGSDGNAVCKLDVDGPARVRGYTVAGLPPASAGAGQIIFVSNESGGAILAFSDGTSWRRVTDRAVVS